MNMAESAFIIDVTRENYDELMQTSSTVPVLIDFWASWCQPCLMLTPILERLAGEYRGKFLLGKLDTEQEQEIAARFGIRSIPTVKLFRDGRPVDEFMGALPEQAVREFLDRHVARESDLQVAEARERLRSGDIDGAIALLSEAREADPDNDRVAIALAEAQLTAGDIAAAEATVGHLPVDELADPAVAALRDRLYFASEAADAPAVTELETRLADDPDDPEARYQLAMRKLVEQDYESAIELLLGLMRKDRTYRDDAAHRALLKVFELLRDDPRVSGYRRRMATLLF